MNQYGVRNKFSPRISVPAPEGNDGRVQEHYKDQVDINNILAKYRKTGVIDHVKKTQAKYGDFTDMLDVAGNLDKVKKAEQAFEQLPAELRNKFKNSIPAFFEYLKDDANTEECIKMGLKKPKDKAPEPITPGQPDKQTVIQNETQVAHDQAIKQPGKKADKKA